jgi:hypothetical protein
MDFNRPDDEGVTPFLVAASSQQFGEWFGAGPGFQKVPDEWAADRIEDFHLAGSDPFAKDDLGRTALTYSAMAISFDFGRPPAQFDYVTPMLLDLGLDVNKIDRLGMTAIDWADAEHNFIAGDLMRAWTQDTAGPELLDATTQQGDWIGATLVFDEAMGPLDPQDFTLVSDVGETVPVRLEREELASGNTLVRVIADPQGQNLGAGFWRVYVEPTATDVAGNGYVSPESWRLHNTPAFAEFAHLPGDANLDGIVDLSDFLALRRGFGLDDATPAQGDFDLDGDVDLSDFLVLRRNFGEILPLAPAGDFGGRDGDGEPPAGANAFRASRDPIEPPVVPPPGETSHVQELFSQRNLDDATLFGDDDEDTVAKRARVLR